VKGGIRRERRFTRGHSTGGGSIDFGSFGFAKREVEFWSGIVSVRHWGCWRFWAWGPGYLYDILELGSYLVGREELGFGQCFAVAVKEASGGQTKD